MSKYSNKVSLPLNFEGMINARVPGDVFYFFDDFMGCSWSVQNDENSGLATKSANNWLITAVNDGSEGSNPFAVDATYTAPSTLGGIMRITTIASPDDGTNMQVNGTAFAIDEDIGLPLYFETRFRTADVSNTDIAIGLSAVDTEIITTGADDFVGFLLEEGVLYAHTAESSNEKNTDTAITEADGAASSNDGWVRCAFYFDGDNTVSFFVDDNDDGEFDFVVSRTVSTGTDYIPDDQALTPTIEAITGTTATAETADIDYVFAAQQRYHA